MLADDLRTRAVEFNAGHMPSAYLNDLCDQVLAHAHHMASRGRFKVILNIGGDPPLSNHEVEILKGVLWQNWGLELNMLRGQDLEVSWRSEKQSGPESSQRSSEHKEP